MRLSVLLIIHFVVRPLFEVFQTKDILSFASKLNCHRAQGWARRCHPATSCRGSKALLPPKVQPSHPPPPPCQRRANENSTCGRTTKYLQGPHLTGERRMHLSTLKLSTCGHAYGQTTKYLAFGRARKAGERQLDLQAIDKIVFLFLAQAPGPT